VDKRYVRDANAFVSPYLQRRLRALDEVLVAQECQATRSGRPGAALLTNAMADGLAATTTAASNLEGDFSNGAD
jgi:hypothetical protein